MQLHINRCLVCRFGNSNQNGPDCQASRQPNGIYNDQIAICDANGDGLISLQEAETYAARSDAKMAKRESVKDKSASDAGDVFISDQPPKTKEAPISQTGLFTR
jgi:hypothetical protein